MKKATFGKRVREARIKKSYSQHDLSSQAGIGSVYISEIERGLKIPSINVFIQSINALDVSADYVLRDELVSGKEYIHTEITEKLLALTPDQLKTATAILNAFLNSIL